MDISSSINASPHDKEPALLPPDPLQELIHAIESDRAGNERTEGAVYLGVGGELTQDRVTWPDTVVEGETRVLVVEGVVHFTVSADRGVCKINTAR